MCFWHRTNQIFTSHLTLPYTYTNLNLNLNRRTRPTPSLTRVIRQLWKNVLLVDLISIHPSSLSLFFSLIFQSCKIHDRCGELSFRDRKVCIYLPTFEPGLIGVVFELCEVAGLSWEEDERRGVRRKRIKTLDMEKTRRKGRTREALL